MGIEHVDITKFNVSPLVDSINAMVDGMGQRDSWRHHFQVHQDVSNTPDALGRMAKRAEGGMDHVKREQSGDAPE